MGSKAIDAPKTTGYLVEPERLTIIGLDTKDGPEHALWDERISFPVDDRLVANIKVHGVLQPILIRKDGDVFEVIDGRQRVRAARKANKQLTAEGDDPIRVKVLLERGSDKKMMAVGVSTNAQRRDNTPMVKARKAGRLLERGYTEDEIAIEFGVSGQTIRNWFALLDLDDSIQKAVDDGKVKASAVSSLAKLSKKEQKEKFKEIMAEAEETGKRPTQRQAENKAGTESAKTKAPGKKEIKRLISLDEDVLFNAGIDEHAIKFLRWAIGDLPASSIGGLTGLLQQAEKEAKAKKPAPKPKKEKSKTSKSKTSKSKTSKSKTSKSKTSKSKTSKAKAPKKPPKRVTKGKGKGTKGKGKGTKGKGKGTKGKGKGTKAKGKGKGSKSKGKK